MWSVLWFGGKDLVAQSGGGGGGPAPALLLIAVWAEAVSFSGKGEIKGWCGTVSKVPSSSDRLGFYNPRSDLCSFLQPALSTGNLQNSGQGSLVEKPIPTL